jgi:hypothetical protein
LEGWAGLGSLPGGDGNTKTFIARHWWLMPVLLATWEAEIRKIVVQNQPRQVVGETPSPK